MGKTKISFILTTVHAHVVHSFSPRLIRCKLVVCALLDIEGRYLPMAVSVISASDLSMSCFKLCPVSS